MKDYFSNIDMIKSFRDRILYGTSTIIFIERSKFNPLRYLMGISKVKRINPSKIYIKSEDK